MIKDISLFCNTCKNPMIRINIPMINASFWDCANCTSPIRPIDLEKYNLGYFHSGNNLIPQFPNCLDYMEGFNSKQLELKYKENLLFMDSI